VLTDIRPKEFPLAKEELNPEPLANANKSDAGTLVFLTTRFQISIVSLVRVMPPILFLISESVIELTALKEGDVGTVNVKVDITCVFN
jgi:hypothetical protein